MRYKQNKKFIDPRYFMDEKTETTNEGVSNWIGREAGSDLGPAIKRGITGGLSEEDLNIADQLQIALGFIKGAYETQDPQTAASAKQKMQEPYLVLDQVDADRNDLYKRNPQLYEALRDVVDVYEVGVKSKWKDPTARGTMPEKLTVIEQGLKELVDQASYRSKEVEAGSWSL